MPRPNSYAHGSGIERAARRRLLASLAAVLGSGRVNTRRPGSAGLADPGGLAPLAAVLSTHAQDDGRSLGPDSVAQAAVQERQRRQEIDALQAIARELRTLNDRVLDLVREMRDLRQEMERKH